MRGCRCFWFGRTGANTSANPFVFAQAFMAPNSASELPPPRASGSRLISRALGHPVIVSPADHLIPAAIGQFSAAGDVERERNAKCPRDHLAVGDAGEGVVDIAIEHRCRKIELRRRTVPHELR